MPKNAPLRAIDSGRASGGGALYVTGGAGGAYVLPEHNALPGLLVGDPHAQYLTPERGAALFVPLTRQITTSASSGLSGGGELSGNLALALAAGVAGNGLALAAGVLTVGTTGLGLDTTSTQVRLTSSSNPGAYARILASNAAGELTLVGASLGTAYVGVLDLGVDTIYEDASYLQVAGAREVNFGQTIRSGTNWSVTPAGALTAASGNVAGDLYAAASAVRIINHTHGYPHAHVVINPSASWSLDEQFGVDIDDNLLVRGYIVGRHALQIKDALMICHFDGAEPCSTNFTGNPAGHMGQPGVASGGLIYRPGRFGKGVQVARATTNLMVDPSCEYDASLSLWTKFSNDGSFTATRSTEVAAVYGANVGKLAAGAGATGLFTQSVTLAAGRVVLSVFVRRADGAAVTGGDCVLYVDGNVPTNYVSVGDGWYRLWYYTAAAAGGATSVGMRVQAGATVYVDGWQVEQFKDQPSPYADGSMGAGHAWTGTAHASTSTRSASALSHALAEIHYKAPLTLAAWADLDGAQPRNYQYLWFAGSDDYSAYVRADGKLIVGGIDCGAMPAGWTHVALATSGNGTVTAYVNGTSKGSRAITRLNLSSIYTGARLGANQCDGLIDEVAVIGRALAADELRAICDSDAPIFAETSTWHWRAGANRFWVDAEGMWMLNALGQPMLGAYAGDEANPSASKTWGGLALAASDLLMGDSSRGGYVRWDDSAAALEVKGSFTVTGGNAATTTALATGLAGKLGLGEAADDINDNVTTIDGGKITTGTIAANRLSVASLSAITSYLGTVYAGPERNRIVINDVNLGLTYTGDYGSGTYGSTGRLAWYRDPSTAAEKTLELYVQDDPDYGLYAPEVQFVDRLHVFRFQSTNAYIPNLILANNAVPASIARVWHSLNDGYTSGLVAEDSAKLNGTAAAAYALLASPALTGSPTINGYTPYHTGNLTPGNYALLSGAAFTGAISSTNHIQTGSWLRLAARSTGQEPGNSQADVAGTMLIYVKTLTNPTTYELHVKWLDAGGSVQDKKISLL